MVQPDQGLSKETDNVNYRVRLSPSVQQIAWVDRETGESGERRLTHRAEAEEFYRELKGKPVRVGIEATGHSRWFERLLAELNLFLTGDEWSGERRYDDRGHPSGYDWYFDFNEGRTDNDPSGFPYSSSLMRALCVRGPRK